MIGGFIAAFIFAQFISVGGYLLPPRMGLRDRRSCSSSPSCSGGRAGCWEASRDARRCPGSGWRALAPVPLTGIGNYPLHLMIMCLLWAFVYTSWALMGRLGMVSLGHGAFLGIGAYGVVMGWNHFGLSPWIGTAGRARDHRGGGLRDRLSVLPAQDRRALFRAGHARAVGGGAHDHRRAARPDRRLARRHAQHRARRLGLVAGGAAVLVQGGVVLHRPRPSGWPDCGSGRGWTARWRGWRWRRSARRRTPPRRSASTSRGSSWA